ncbi:CaiB/BaiF CoA transferase family protein [Sphingobacterium bovistauri]|uniref:CoA transferase n=1 Tax=Sphingobacterium bovistauri TaxID=2781959 RepID=A0ABS7Z3M7_9SPHI|nr:CaiB/BaiF CoA-transferase family protein [Sphingobacterium bovistauri]MCA5004730.1 CoA transferase [Sphingobacterium bovistauri]
MKKPLEGLVVLEFSQFLAGPTAGLRLADMGARVIKIERPNGGDAGRQIAIKNLFVEDSSLVFHTINRNKESFAADLKDPEDLALVKKLIEKADVITHNFRPGIMEKLGLDYENVKLLNDKIIYAVVTGYGTKGPWSTKPGQDLLVQSVSGLTWLTGNKQDGPIPFGLSVVDMYCATHLTQGILAALIRRAKTNKSALVEVSLLESALDMQFEVLTSFLNDGNKNPNRSEIRGAGHAYLSAPYGIYKTTDSYIAIAMGDINKLLNVLSIDGKEYSDSATWFRDRDTILKILGENILSWNAKELELLLEENGFWSAEIKNYTDFLNSDGFLQSKMLHYVKLHSGNTLTTTRSVYQIDGKYFLSDKPAPKIGEHNAVIFNDYLND